MMIFKNLILYIRDKRVEILKDNEEHLKDELKKLNEGATDGFEDEDDDEEDGDDGEGDIDSDEEEKQFRKDMKQIQKLKKKQDGMIVVGDDDEDIDDEDDDSEAADSDYEYMGGDLAIYDSALDDVDELLYIQEILSRINQADSNYFNRLLGNLNPDEMTQFNDNMANALALKEREEVIRKQIEEVEQKLHTHNN